MKDRDDIFNYFQSELRAHCWIQISDDTLLGLIKKIEHFSTNCSYQYIIREDGVKVGMNEFHVDTHISSLEYKTQQHREMGGDLSMRANPSGRLLFDPAKMRAYIISLYFQRGTGKVIQNCHLFNQRVAGRS